MCRGLAVLLTDKNRVICKGMSSHFETINNCKIEDKSLKYEVIIDDSNKNGYTVEIDSLIDNEKIKKETVAGLPIVIKWITKNETKVLRWLLHCQSYASRKNTDNSYQKTEGDTDNSYQKTKGNTDNSSQETEGNICNFFQESEGNIYNFRQKTKGDTNNSYQKTKGNTDNSMQETKGDTDNSLQKTKGNTNNSGQKTEGNTNNSGQKTEGNIYNSHQETGREWYMGCVTLTKYPNTTEIIKDAKNNYDLTLPELIRYVAKNSKKVLKKLGKEGEVIEKDEKEYANK